MTVAPGPAADRVGVEPAQGADEPSALLGQDPCDHHPTEDAPPHGNPATDPRTEDRAARHLRRGQRQAAEP